MAKFAKALAILRSEIESELPVQTVQVLIDIALHPGGMPKDVSSRTGLSASSTTRHIQTLSTGRMGRAGLGLVSVFANAADGRQRHLQLTQSGKAIIRRLVVALSSAR